MSLIRRILIVGLGSIGSRHLRLARSLFPEAEIKVLRHSGSSFIPEFSDGTFTSIQDAISFAPQIAVIASPATLHIETAQRLAESGVHVLIEKPISDSINGLSRLITTCKNNNIVLATGYNLRFSPSLIQYKGYIDQGIIGKVLSVHCEVGQYLPTWRPTSDYRQGVSSRLELGGGVLLELSHELDYLRLIFGDVQWVRAKLSKQSGLEIDVEDSAYLTLGFIPDVEGSQLIGVANLDFIRHDNTRICTAIGENGSLRWNGISGDVDLFQEGARDWTKLYNHLPIPDETYFAEWIDFLESIKSKRMPFVTGVDGLRVLEIIEAARISSETGIQVKVIHDTQIERFKA